MNEEEKVEIPIKFYKRQFIIYILDNISRWSVINVQLQSTMVCTHYEIRILEGYWSDT